MHFLRLATFCLGAWLVATPLVMLVTSDNTQSVGALLGERHKEVDKLLLKITPDEAGMLLHHHASVVNRRFVYIWEIVQLVLGGVILTTMFFGSGAKRYAGVLCLLMLISVAFLHWFLSPQMEKHASAVEFLSTDAASVSVDRDRLRSLESGYQTTEGVKVLLGILVSVSLVRRRRRRSSASAEFE